MLHNNRDFRRLFSVAEFQPAADIDALEKGGGVKSQRSSLAWTSFWGTTSHS